MLNVDSKPLSGTPSRIPAYHLMMAQTDYLIPDDAMIYISDLESVFKSHWGKKSLGMGFIEEANPLKVFINLTMSFLKLAKNSLKMVVIPENQVHCTHITPEKTCYSI